MEVARKVALSFKKSCLQIYDNKHTPAACIWSLWSGWIINSFWTRIMKSQNENQEKKEQTFQEVRRNVMRQRKRIDGDTPFISVDCPARLQEKMRRNLARAAVNRFDRKRAVEASELLASIKSNGHEITAQPSDLLATNPVITSTTPVANGIKRSNSKLRNLIGEVRRKCTDRILVFGRHSKR